MTLTFHHLSAHSKKSLGQNYLIDENICRNIVNSFDIKENDFVIEIGSGKGEITKYLIKATRNIIAVEIDKNNAAYLLEKYPDLRIIDKDFLKLDLNETKSIYKNITSGSVDDSLRVSDLVGSWTTGRVKAEEDKIRIIGNIPYNITTDILFKLVDNRSIIRDAQIMMQEEVAQRIVASPGTKAYGILSVMLQVFCFPKLLFKVSKNCFYPKPKIDSRIVYFDFSKNLLDEISDIGFFEKFVRTIFGARRKTLRNTLKKLNIDSNNIKMKFDFSKRAESLNVKELIDLCNKLHSHTSSIS